MQPPIWVLEYIGNVKAIFGDVPSRNGICMRWVTSFED